MSAETRCHSCGATGLSIFYEVDDIPVHSVLLMPTREEARGYPRRNLKLGFCPACGFIQNTIFDPTVHEYSTRCEESQGFSATFNAFARKVAARYIEQYDLRDKDVLEIGCGKGEFLVLLCEMGPNRGIGIDPGYVPERTAEDAASRVRFIQDFYSQRYADLQADFVCCRHTLEHIQPTGEFLRMIRGTVETKLDTIVAFELPDVERVLEEQAFWDIYYEHCSYFSLGSLARLFRASGFDLLHLEKEFGGQYLLIEGRAGEGGAGSALAGEDDLERLNRAVERFRREVPKKLAGWKQSLARWADQGRRVVLWGSSSKAVSFLTTLGVGDEVGLVTDINTYRQNMFIPGSGHRIAPPAELADYRPDVVIAMNPIYLDEIGKELARMGLHPELTAV